MKIMAEYKIHIQQFIFNIQSEKKNVQWTWGRESLRLMVMR